MSVAGSTRVWVLNPDVERELAGAVQSTARHIAQMRERVGLFRFLTLGESSVLATDLTPRRFAGEQALVWCPTPSVLEAARNSGLAVGQAPSFDVLRRVNDKRFPSQVCADLVLPGRSIVEAARELDWLSLPLRLKRPFGFAGKGQRVLRARGRSDDQRWIDESLRQGPLVVEPEISDLEQVSCHGVTSTKDALLGRPVGLTTDRYGAPISVQRVLLDATVEKRVLDATNEISRRLAGAGYFGPFGCDHAIVSGEPRLLDLNARFTLGFSAGFGAERDTALTLVQRLTFPTCA